MLDRLSKLWFQKVGLYKKIGNVSLRPAATDWKDMRRASAKEQMLEVLRNQPDDSSFDELLRELALVRGNAEMDG